MRNVLQGTKAGLFSVVFSCIGVFILALFAQFFTMSDNLLPVINQIVKVLAVVLGTAIFVREEKFLPKSLLCALTFWLVTQILFLILGGTFSWAQFGLDLVVSVVAALVVAVLKSRK